MSQAEELLATMSEELPSHEHAVVDVDKYFVIDPDTRAMSTVDDGYSEDQPIVIMQFDHNSEKFTFEVPRYVEGHDMLLCDVAKVHYNNVDNESGYENQGVHDMYDIQINPNDKDTIICTWLISRDATQLAGALGFLVQYLCHDDDGAVVYEWHTDVYTNVVVNEGRNYGEASVSGYSDVLEEWRAKLFGAGDSILGDIVYASKMQQSEISAAGAAQIDAINNKTAESLASIPDDYLTTYQMAEEGARTKADAIVKSTQGSMIVVNDSSDDYIRNLRVFGKTTQTTTTGKNLLNILIESQSFNGGVIMVNPDKTIELRGKFGKNTALAIGKFAHSGEFIFSVGIDSASMNNSYLYIAYPDDNNIGWYGEDKTFTNDGTERTVFLVIVAGSYKDVTLKPMIRFSSIEDSSYEPYSGGFASPSPDWPQDMVGVGDGKVATAWIHGKNLVYSSETTTVTMNNGITISSVQGSSEYILGGTQSGSCNASANLTKGGIELTSGTFTLSVMGLRGNDYINLQRYNDGVDKVTYITTGITNKTSRTFTIGNPQETVYVELMVHHASTYNNDVVTIQLEAGGTATEHEDHKLEQLIHRFAHASRNRILNGIPVDSDGNYTDDAGQQWVCDEVDFERGMYVKRINTLTFDGTSSSGWTHIATYADAMRFDYTSAKVKPNTDVFANQFSEIVISTNMAEGINVHSTQTHIQTQILGSRLPSRDVDGLMEYFKTNPLTVTYILETPLEIDLTPDENNFFKTLCTNCPNTTVMNNFGAWMELTYNADTKTYIDNGIKDTVAAVMEEIENGSY